MYFKLFRKLEIHNKYGGTPVAAKNRRRQGTRNKELVKVGLTVNTVMALSTKELENQVNTQTAEILQAMQLHDVKPTSC